MDNKVWVGIDAGKELHWAHVLDASGQQILSRRVENDEVDLLKLIDEVLALSEEPVQAVDQPGGSAALLLALLWERDQQVLSFPGPPSTGRATPTLGSPTPMPATLTSSPSRPG